MHELAITQSIVGIVLDKQREAGALRVRSVWIEAGKARNLMEEWVQRYFDHYAEGTAAEGAVVHVSRVPVAFRCNSCFCEFELPPHSLERLHCPACGGDDYALVHGRELSITGIELEFPENVGAVNAAPNQTA